MATLKLKQPSKRLEQQKQSQHTQASQQGPEDRKRRDKEIMAHLQTRWPGLFNPANPQPLAIRTAQDIRHHPSWPWPDGRSKALNRVLYQWTSKKAYLMALAAPGSQRVDIYGNRAPVSDEHRRRAAEQLFLARPDTNGDTDGDQQDSPALTDKGPEQRGPTDNLSAGGQESGSA